MAGSPEQMRTAMGDYVRAVHQAYLDAAETLPPADRARLPLFTDQPFTVIAVGTRYLHVLGTTEQLPAPAGPEVSIEDHVDDLRWTLRFFDPVVAPALGLIDEKEHPQPEQVRETLGVRSVLYHLSVPPGGGLTGHHAQHAGTGLAHSHAAADRDFTSLANLSPRQGPLVAEMYAAHVNHMPTALRLLANEFLGEAVLSADMTDMTDIRRQTLEHARQAWA
ncbi:MAG: hypothetical protein O2815_02575 [Actinomycetota bacterium]|nr:hypothetical protein [Actinomycetota bacterium]